MGQATEIQLSWKRTVRCGLPEAVDRLANELRSQDFAIVSKVDVPGDLPASGLKKAWKASLFQSCFPRSECAPYLLDPRSAKLLQCRALLIETTPGQVTIEITRSVKVPRRSKTQFETLSRQMNDRLELVLRNLEEHGESSLRRRNDPFSATSDLSGVLT